MRTKAVARTMTRTNCVLAIDMTALWNRQTTGIQRVIRQVTPYLAAAAAKRGWDVVLVRHTNQGLEELASWTGDYNPSRISRDLNQIANGQVNNNNLLKLRGSRNFFARTSRAIGNLGVGQHRVRTAIRMLRNQVPSNVRSAFRNWKSKARKICSNADAYISLSGGILPAMPPPCTPPERTVTVIHDLIPLHHSIYCSTEIVNAFVKNFSDIAFRPYACKERIVTASRYVASDIAELFYSLARKQIEIDIVQWGYDRDIFFPQPDVRFRHELGIPEDALLIAAVSTQDVRKRFAEIEEAVCGMNAYAVFLGQGKPRRVGNAIYLGYVSDDQLRKAYSSCDVVVNWSAAEGFGLPTIEALACGARVVIPPDNLTSIEVGGENVVVARRADVSALREAIQVAATMPRPKPDLSRFHWATTAARLESMLWPKSMAYRQAG